MAFPGFLDTCVLFSPTLTDTLLRIAEEDASRPHWSVGVLDELRTVLVREGLPDEKADKRIAAMESAFQDASVAGYEPLIDAELAVIKEVEQSDWQGAFYYSEEPAPTAIPWAKSFAAYFPDGAARRTATTSRSSSSRRMTSASR